MQPVQQTPQYWLSPGPELAQRTWQRRTRRPVIIISSIVSAVLALIAIGAIGWGLQERDFTAEGAVVLADGQFDVSSIEICGGAGEFEDVRDGTRVRILDEDLSILEEGELANPQLSDDQCRLGFAISGVPEGRDHYVVEIGTSLRYEATESVLKRGITLEP